MKIGKAVRDIRLNKKMSKNELCRLTDFNKGYVYYLESDLISPTMGTLVKMGLALNMPVWEIVKLAEMSDNFAEYLQKGIDAIE